MDKISVLTPTRGRPQPLEATIRLLMHLALHPERVEVLLRVDDDDPVDYENKIWPLFSPRKAPPINGRVLRGKKFGYQHLNEYFNELAEAATGRWCLLWGDDNFMATPGWDTVLDAVPNKLAMAVTSANHGKSPCTFPIFTRSYYETLGHVSLNCHNDTWIEETSQAAGIMVPVPITIFHAYMPGVSEKSPQTSADYYSEPMKQARAIDIEKLKAAK